MKVNTEYDSAVASNENAPSEGVNHVTKVLKN